MRAGLSGVVLVAAIAVVGVNGPGPVPAVRSQHRHAPNIIHEKHGRYASSTNWSGYSVDGPKGSVTDVKGSWKVPSVTCGSTNAYAAFWVGIDGDNSNTVEQIGTDSDCVNGVATYYAWYEFYPKFPVNISVAINPGDVIFAEVTAGAKGAFTVTLTNESMTGKKQTFTTSGKVPSAAQSSAEWIAEAPWSGGVLPLADFYPAAYFGNDNTKVSGTCFATVGKASGPIGSFGSNVFEITMVTSSGATKAYPTPLTPSLTTGTSFDVNWVIPGP